MVTTIIHPKPVQTLNYFRLEQPKVTIVSCFHLHVVTKIPNLIG